MNSSKPAHKARGIFRLLLVVAFFLFFMHLGSPFLIEHVPGLKTYANAVDETGITPGALYYTDVPQTVDGEMNNRDAIRYFTEHGSKR